MALPPSHLVESGSLGDSEGEEDLDFLEGRFGRLMELFPALERKLGSAVGAPDLE